MPRCSRRRRSSPIGVGNLVFTGDVDDPGDAARRCSGSASSGRAISAAHPRLAFRPLPRHAVGGSARAADRADAGAARGASARRDAPTRRFCASTSSSPACRPACSSSRCSQSNPPLLELLATIMGAAPRLADIITRRPHVLDGLLDPASACRNCRRATISPSGSTAFLAGVDRYEEVLDRLRIFAAEQKFLIGVRLLTGAIDAARAGTAFSRPRRPDARRGARGGARGVRAPPWHASRAARSRVLGMGKLGGREMTAGSDLDLILLYDHDDDAERIGRRRRSAPSHYYHPPDPAPDRGALGADRRGRALRGRLAAAPVRQQGPGRDPYRRLPASTSARRPGPGSTWR